MNRRIIAFVTLFLFIIFSNNLFSRSKRVNQIPNGTVNRCANCHINPQGGGARTAFGTEVENNHLDGNGDVIWSYALASLDSDGDGIPNGVELQDPNALWMEGMPAPGNMDRVVNPGVSASNHGDILTVQFSNMDPHVGQLLEIRLVDLYDNSEVARQKLDPINATEFQFFFDGVIIGHNYQVDFYADLNQNGQYDAPGDDHAWRLMVENVQGDTIVEFSHNANFTDIQWPYMLTVNLEGMSPHLGQQFGVRLVDKKTRLEINRSVLSEITSEDFEVKLPGIFQDETYWVDFYADLNQNGLYDSPPVDHAWRLELEKPEGDTTLTFSHNGSFIDINWPYLLTLQASNMNPHISQLFEMRVIDLKTQLEVGRTRLESIHGPEFALSVPGLDSSGYYKVEYYADLNNDSLYQFPPTDHAWLSLTGKTNGDAVVDFSHNANFSNIDWDYILEFEFGDMTPHVNQLFEVRVIENSSGLEVSRESLIIYDKEFTLFLPGIKTNTDYTVDFYADLNNNGFYDAPPTDHAWRLSYNPGDDGNNNLSFKHNTSFIDIEWKYLFNLALEDMDPHLGQLFELRLMEDGVNEIGRFKTLSLATADFSVPVGGITPGKSYNVDFYADFNGNRTYDSPPADHAWRETFTAANSDTVLMFSHNANFVDINFPTTIKDEIVNLAGSFELYANYPNPFNPVTNIRFELPQSSRITLTIYNSLGEKISTLVNSDLNAGSHSFQWNATDNAGNRVASGIYFYRLEAKNFEKTRPMILLK